MWLQIGNILNERAARKRWAISDGKSRDYGDERTLIKFEFKNRFEATLN